MSDSRPEPRPKELDALVAYQRDIEGPPPDATARLFARMQAAILAEGASASPDAQGEGAPSGPGEASAASAASAGATAWAPKLVSGLLIFALGAGTGAAVHAGLTSAPHAPAVAQAPHEPFAPPGEPAPPVAPTLAPPAPVAEPSVPPPPEPPSRRAARPVVPGKGGAPAATEAVSRLDEERRLLEAARTALLRERPADALAALRTHRTRHPDGALAEERDVLHVAALAASGDADGAREAGAEFRARYPNSLLLPMVEEALRTIR
jgi:hypothetical protein